MDVGFTGTQRGMTRAQFRTLQNVLGRISGMGGSFHHGDCIGADLQSCVVAWSLGFWIVRHPPIIENKRAFSACHEDREPKEYLQRNRDIVDETQFLIVTPAQEAEQLRSGTWATFRYARKRGLDLLVIPPSGLCLADVTNRIRPGILADFHVQAIGDKRGHA